MAYGKIGRKGTSKGPSKSSMVGSRQNPGNLGRSTGMKSNGGPNHFVDAALKRRGINAGPGGTQRP